MATIRKRGEMQWEVQIRRKGYPSAQKTFESRKDAELWAATIESEMGRGVFQDRTEAEATTLKEALERYLAEISIKKAGYEVEKVRIGVWLRDDLASRSLASLKGSDLAKWRDRRLRDVSASSAKKDLAIISHLFTVAQKEWGLAVGNPAQSISMPVEDNSRDRRLEEGEEARLLDAFDAPNGRGSNIWMNPLVQLAIASACRQSELLALEWTDVDLAKSWMRIRGKERENGQRKTKNGDKFRDVPLTPAAIKALKEMPRSIGGRVFPTTASAVKQSFVRACKRAGIENLHFHDLRHEGTSRLAERLQLHELMKVTGHKDSRMLARYYHPRAEDLAKKLA